MIKNVTQIEAIVNDKSGKFLLDSDTSLAIAKEMCYIFLKIIGQIEDAAKAQSETNKDEEMKSNNPES